MKDNFQYSLQVDTAAFFSNIFETLGKKRTGL